MPKNNRCKTKYPGVYFIEGKRGQGDRIENIYYITFRKNGKRYEEKAGRQFKDDMTPARASHLRALKIEGVKMPNTVRREKERKEKAERWTFDQLWEEFKVQNSDLKSLSRENYRYIKYLQDPFGNKEPKKITEIDVSRLRVKLQKKFKPATVKNTLAQLRRIANFGVEQRLCQGLTFKIKIKPVHNLKTEDLTTNEMSRLLVAIDKDILKNQWPYGGKIMKLVLLTGLRRGEIFKLQWRDLNFERDTLLLRDPKGGVDQYLPLNAEAKTLLKEHPKTKGSDYVFPNRKGGQLLFIGYYLKEIRAQARLPEDFRTLHGLRHVYASMLASSGQVSLYELQKLLTHKSSRMTERYAHLRDEAIRKAANVASIANYLK